MKKLSIIFATILLGACAGMEQLTLEGVQRKPANDEETEQQVYEGYKEENRAIFINRGNLLLTGDWKFSTDQARVINSDTLLKIDADGVGKAKQFMYADFDNYDFSGGLALKVAARAEGNVIPSLRFELVDVFGKRSNAINLECKLNTAELWNTYYFDLDPSFSQVFPEYSNFDASKVKQLRVYVNEGSKNFEGIVEINEMRLILSKEMLKTRTSNPGSAAPFVLNLSDPKLKLTTKGNIQANVTNDYHLRLSGNSIGHRYESVEFEIPMQNFLVNPKLKVVATCTAGNETNSYLRIDMKDINGSLTNRLPVIIKLINDGKAHTYEVDFNNRFKQSNPTQNDVDANRIEALRLYLNPGYMPFTGEVLVHSIETIK